MLNFKSFINEKKSKEGRVLYFLHPSITFEKTPETKSIELIDIYFDSPLIYNIPDKRGKFFTFADELDTVVILPFTNGKISPKMWRRLVYSFDKGLDVFYIHPKKYKIIKIEDIEFFEEKTIDKETWKEIRHDDDIEQYFTEVEE